MTPETIGHYRITALIGSGGMGEVYRARDTKLGRDVAIKILPPVFAADASRMARFEREARVLASLNHPNIAHIYGVEDRALVMELVEGQSPKGPMPFDDAWKIALQMADALEYAHDKGVVHRDLKPANVKVTPEGVVKLLDFGLAKAYSSQPDTAPGDPEASPTVTLGATVAGTIMGTAAYMSPEQARGKPVDKRADIWSWGVMLYELLTGERMFQGEDAAETLAAVIHKQPDLDKAPPQARRVLAECLQKDPKLRLRDIGDATRLLESGTESPARAKSPPHKLWIAAAAMFAVISALASFEWWRATRPAPHELTRLEVDLGPNISLAAPTPTGESVVLSPDGRRLVYSAGAGGQTRLFTRRLDQPKGTELPGTEGAADAFFSPDSQWIGFYAAGNLKKISVEGGAVVSLVGLNVYGGADWGEEGSIVVSEPALGRGLLRVPSGGGSATVLAPRNSGEVALAWPQFLPGGKALLFTSATGLGTAIEVLTFADHRRKMVARGGVNARYLPASDHEGYLVYTDKGTMFAIQFDLGKLETYGTRTPILDDVAYTKAPEGGQFNYSPSGALVYRKGARTGELTTIQSVGTEGHRQPLLAKPGTYQYPKFSSDGERLAMSELTGATPDISVYDLKRDRRTQLTFGDGIYSAPVWTPDGQYIVFSSTGKGLWWTRSDGSGQPQPLFPNQDILLPSSFTKDGKQLAYSQIGGRRLQIWTVPVEEDSRGLKAGTPEPFLKDERARLGPRFSPDDRWLAYSQESSGIFTFYVRPFSLVSGQGAQWQISNVGGYVTDRLAWSPPSGHELYYQSGDQIMAVSYTVQGDAFVPGMPHVWISKVGGTDWDLDPNGKRIAVVTPVGSTEAPGPDHSVVFLQNFVDYLKQKVPLNK